jgi:peroxiredoxin/uncharacterized membrane protein YphA (DoxX/SURF4 family)
MGTITLVARALVAVVFATAAATKLRDPGATRRTFRDFGVGERLSRIAVLLPAAELTVAVGLVIIPTARWAAIAAGLLLLLFIAGMVNALRLGRRPDCGCFGGLRPTPIGRLTLIRNGALLVVAGFVAVFGPGPSVNHWLASQSPGRLAAVAVVLAGAAAMLIRTTRTAKTASPESAPTDPSPAPSKLYVGQQAPAFSLDGASGEPHTLDALLGAGRPVVLVFGSPTCGPCLSLFAQVGSWQAALTARLQIVIIGTGDPDQMRLVSQEYGLADVLVDGDRTVLRAYGMFGTPAALAVTPKGLVASGPAFGQDAIEDLIRLALHRLAPMFEPWNRTTHAA